MSLLSRIGGMFLDGIGPIEVQARHASEFPSFDEQMAAIRNRGLPETYRYASVGDAMGVPAIFSAVSLIANTVGTLSMEAFRRGVRMPQEDAPRLILRPNPFTTLRAFLRDTAYHLATRGEAWWWIAVRDSLDDQPLSLYPIPPWEVVVSPNERDRLRPTIRWNDREIRNENIRHITYMPGRDGRGRGPLQECGAAVSVAVEAQQWAANFFSGSLPSIIGKTEEMLTEDELKALDRQWLEKPPNLPRWLGAGIEMQEAPYDPTKAQLTESREFNVGDVARMFNMPGSLIEHQMSGSSLRYQNDETVWTDFQRRCLSPHYLEPIEQEMSDLLTRSMVARFNLKQLLRASAKQRMEVHQIAIPLGIYDAETAAEEEGYAPGNVDYAPVPMAPPQAIPSLVAADRPLGTRAAMAEVRCGKCGKLAGRAAGSFETKCARCGTLVAA